MIPLHSTIIQYYKAPSAFQQRALQTVEKPMEVLEGRSPPIAKPKPATCAVVSEPLRSKEFLSPFAARRAKGS